MDRDLDLDLDCDGDRFALCGGPAGDLDRDRDCGLGGGGGGSVVALLLSAPLALALALAGASSVRAGLALVDRGGDSCSARTEMVAFALCRLVMTVLCSRVRASCRTASVSNSTTPTPSGLTFAKPICVMPVSRRM